MPNQNYLIPVVQQDLRNDESLMQLFDALALLDKTVGDVFSRISTRVTMQRDRLVLVNNRVNVARAKVQKIVGWRHATKVMSSAKYPGPTVFQGSEAVFAQISEPLNHVAYENVTNRIGKVELEVIKEKLNFFHVDLKAKRKRNKEITEDEESCEGLGGIPKNLSSVNNLLLFNTQENPYKKYVTIDPLLGAITKTRNVVEEETNMHAAPGTISSGERYMFKEESSMRYVPGMGSVPEIDTGNQLNLRGIADISFASDVASITIANTTPSVNLPDLNIGSQKVNSNPPPPPPSVVLPNLPTISR